MSVRPSAALTASAVSPTIDKLSQDGGTPTCRPRLRSGDIPALAQASPLVIATGFDTSDTNAVESHAQRGESRDIAS